MKYEWESDAIDEIYPLIQGINEKLPSGFKVMGFAIENEETAEACYASMVENDGSVLISDLMIDVFGDVQDFYNATIDKRTEEFKNV